MIGEAVLGYEAALPAHGWPNWVLSNHDRPRIASRAGSEQARVAAMLLLTLRGTPTIYYGDEIGMADVEIPPQLQQDPARFEGPGWGRDPARTPMRWDDSEGAGFTTGSPWLPIGDVRRVNVRDQRADPRSILQLHRRLIELRRVEAALAVGAWAPLAARGELLAYERSVPGRRLIVALNFGRQELEVDVGLGSGRILVSTELDRASEAVSGRIWLRPNEGLLVEADR